LSRIFDVASGTSGMLFYKKKDFAFSDLMIMILYFITCLNALNIFYHNRNFLSMTDDF